MNRTLKRWLEYLIAIIAGNLIYFTLEPRLPRAAQHRAYHPDLGTLVDLWFCLVVYGLIELFLFLLRRNAR